jgi:antitoxin Phd
MDAGRWSLQAAKNSFSAVVEAAVKGAPQTVTKRGKPAVVVISVAEYDRLRRSRAPEIPSFIEHLLSMPKDGGDFERARIRPRAVKF